ncbi:MAG: mechanosensitive ion channel [Lentisphaerae bacterium]|nr:mechanosensitive ion channel [Lentisphaerota bacterium]MCP4103717.1 mechanosensitive ion channel [Lentisphaerota bacterium]
MTGLLAVSMGILEFSWVVRRSEQSNNLPQPYTAFWGLYAVAMFLRFAGIDGPLIVVFLLPALAIASIILLGKLKKKYSAFDKNLTVLILLFCLSGLLLIIFGFYYFVVVLTLVAFLAFAGVLLGIAFTKLSNRCVKNDNNYSGTVLSLVIFGIPMIWILLIGFFTYLIADLFHVQNLLNRYIYTEVAWEGIAVSLMEVIESIILFFIVRACVYGVNYICSLKKDKETHEIQHPLGTIITYLLWALYVLFVLKIIGVNYTSIMVVLGGMSVGIGFALQHIVENFISGLILVFGKELRPGDFIELKNLSGIIIKVNIRSTVLRTFENTLITIPNSQILSSDVKNWSRNKNNIRCDVKVLVNYGEEIKQVKELLLESANSVEKVVAKPAPAVILMELGEHSMVFSLRLWIKSVWNRVSTQSKVREQITERFEDNSIKFAFQHLDVSIIDEGKIAEANELGST